MKKNTASIVLILFFAYGTSIFAQTINGLMQDDRKAVEGIIVEKYYTATKEDAKDTIGGYLEEGSVTYRIYVDLKPGYNLQAVYAVPKHELFFKTTTKFYNNKEGGARTADQINDKHINDNNVALDSWLTIGVADEKRFGVLKKEDKDSSILKRKGLDKEDGFYLAGQANKILLFGFDLAFFENGKDASYFHSDNGSWASIGNGRAQGNMKEGNKILIAQLTTTGKLSFELNLQVSAPNSAVINFVAKNPEGNEIELKHLTFK